MKTQALMPMTTNRLHPALDQAAQAARRMRPTPIPVVIVRNDNANTEQIDMLKQEVIRLNSRVIELEQEKRKGALFHEVDNRAEWAAKTGQMKPKQLAYDVALTSQGLHFRDRVK